MFAALGRVAAFKAATLESYKIVPIADEFNGWVAERFKALVLKTSEGS
jgi:hypothetical protein